MHLQLPRAGGLGHGLLLCMVLATGAVSADTLRISDGSTLQGAVTKMVDGKVYIDTAFAGELAVPWDQVIEIETTENLPFHLSDGRVIQGVIQNSSPEHIEVGRPEEGGTLEVPKQDVVAIAPPPPPPSPSVEWKGQVVGTLSAADGNSDASSMGLSAETTRRSETDRLNLRGGFFYAEDEGEESRDDLFTAGKYDYFLQDKEYVYVVTRFDRDPLKELELRATAGAGLGYQFLEDAKFDISAELGLSYVDENFENDVDDTAYAAARAAYNLDWWILEEQLRYGQDFEFLLGFEDVEDWLVIWDSAITWKLNSSWSTNGSLRFEYDNTPASGLDELDTRYALGIGYSF